MLPQSDRVVSKTRSENAQAGCLMTHKGWSAGILRCNIPAALPALLVLTALSVYKPKGITRYGWRKQREQRALAQP
jgi:hypothetical protein